MNDRGTAARALARKWWDNYEAAEAVPRECVEVHALIGRMEALMDAASIFGVRGIMECEVARLQKARKDKGAA